MPTRPPVEHVIVHRPSGRTVSRHPSLEAARAAWRSEAFPTKTLVKGALTAWAHAHLIMTTAAAAAAAHRRAIEAEKRSRRA